jgi:hypothetical protein
MFYYFLFADEDSMMKITQSLVDASESASAVFTLLEHLEGVARIV